MSPFRLVYASTSQLSRDPDEERRQIADILLVSRRKNEAADITGALLFSDCRFAQVLEGRRADVEALYATLEHDPRHRNLVLLLAEQLPARQFSRWAMAYVGPCQPADEAVARVTTDVADSDQGARARDLVAFMARILAAPPAMMVVD